MDVTIEGIRTLNLSHESGTLYRSPNPTRVSYGSFFPALVLFLGLRKFLAGFFYILCGDQKLVSYQFCQYWLQIPLRDLTLTHARDITPFFN